MLFPHELSRRILAMFVNSGYHSPREDTGDSEDSGKSDVWNEEDEPFLWTLARACLVGLVYIGCILCFALCLLLVEKTNEDDVFRARANVRKELKRELQLLLVNSSASLVRGEDNLPDVGDFMDAFTNLCKRSNQVPKTTWSFRTGLLLATSVLTTSGYGYVYPTFDASQLFCVFYSIIGIPLSLLFMHKIGFMLLEVYWAIPSTHCKEIKMASFAVIAAFGVLLLILAPAAILTYTERWTYYEATYYTFMSLTTVGLGKDVAGLHPLPTVFDNPHLQLTVEILYQAFLISWVFIGIAYLTLLVNCAPVFEKQLTTKLRVMIRQKMNTYKKLKEVNN